MLWLLFAYKFLNHVINLFKIFDEFLIETIHGNPLQ